MGANLARVQDLTDELRRQLKPLGRQALPSPAGPPSSRPICATPGSGSSPTTW